MYAIAEVYETDIGKVKIGQPATMSSEYGGFKDKLSGTVEHLGLQIGAKELSEGSQDPIQDENSRIVEVKIRIIYTDVREHLPEYATLKAMEYRDLDLSLVVLQESLILAIMGFIPGYLIFHGIYYLMANYLELRVSMNTGIALQVFTLNVLMCSISGAIAIRKLRTGDPADIFY